MVWTAATKVKEVGAIKMWEDNLWINMRKMQKRMDRLFGNFGEGVRKAWTEYNETDDEYILEIEMPGIEKEDIVMNVVDNVIEIRGEKKRDVKQEAEDGGYFSYSKKFTGFAKRINFPEDADLEKIDAIYNNGILKVRIKKKEELKKKRKVIEVK
jgi:HSP20 family protein